MLVQSTELLKKKKNNLTSLEVLTPSSLISPTALLKSPPTLNSSINSNSTLLNNRTKVPTQPTIQTRINIIIPNKDIQVSYQLSPTPSTLMDQCENYHINQSTKHLYSLFFLNYMVEFLITSFLI